LRPGGQCTSTHAAGAHEIAEVEAAALAVEKALERLRREPDIAARRRLAEVVGPTVGRLDAVFAATTAGMDEAEKLVVQPFIDRTVARTISQFTTLCGWEPS
jgi:hypothetical protein